MEHNQKRSDVSDEDLRLLADSAHDFAMIFTDANRNVVRWSKGAESIMGWTEAEVIGKDERDLIFTPEDKAAGIPQQEPDIALREGRAVDDRWHMKKDGSRFFARGIVTPLYDRETGALRGFGKVLLDQTKEKQMEEELQRANETLEANVAERTAALEERQSLLRRIVAAEEQERRRISRELHDQTGQHLTGLALGLKALEDTVHSYAPPNAETDAQFQRLRTVAEELAGDLHHIAVELRPTAIDDMGLLPALRTYVQRWSETSSIEVDFDNFGAGGEEASKEEGDLVRLPDPAKTAVYRVVQEALTNTARHGNHADTRATQVSVTLQRRAGQLQVTIEDNGPGFDVEAARRTGRLGLVGMIERAGLCGGTLDIDSEIGGGTTIILRVPLI